MVHTDREEEVVRFTSAASLHTGFWIGVGATIAGLIMWVVS